MKPNPIPEREPERSEEEPWQPRAFLPTSVIEQQMASARAALTDLESRLESLEDRQMLAMGTSALADSLFLSPDPEPGAEPNGHDRPEPEPAEDAD